MTQIKRIKTDFKSALIITISIISVLFSQAQDSLFRKKSVLDFPEHVNKKRLTGVCIGSVGLYSSIMVGVGLEWYGKQPNGKFHWFNDLHEWNQVDKAGHFYVPYFTTTFTYNMLRWSGMKNTPAALTAGAFGFLSLAAIEIPDGMTKKYGASWSDIVFDYYLFLISNHQRFLNNNATKLARNRTDNPIVC